MDNHYLLEIWIIKWSNEWQLLFPNTTRAKSINEKLENS